MDHPQFETRVAEVRRFGRFYTRQIGVLQEGLLKSPYSLTEARVLYELAHREGVTAAELVKDLGLDPGYLSRILRRFAHRSLIRKAASTTDGRQSHLSLTKAGRAAFAALDRASRDEVAAMLTAIDPDAQARLCAAMQSIERVLSGGAGDRVPFLLRPHRPGDMGWIVHRQAVLYTREYGWDAQFEGLIAGIVAQFIETFDPARACCWVAERDGEVVGSVFVVPRAATEAQLRLLYVEPSVRGLRLGSRLVDEAIRFARDKGYRTMTLWTNDILVSARRIYEAAGFRLIAEEPHRSFGHDLVGQTWSLDL